MELITQFSACDDKIIVRVATDWFLVNTVRDESHVWWNSVLYVKYLQWSNFDFTVTQVIICLLITVNALYVYVLHYSRDKGNADDKCPLRRASLIASCLKKKQKKKPLWHKKQRKRNEWSDMKEFGACSVLITAPGRSHGGQREPWWKIFEGNGKWLMGQYLMLNSIV